MKTTFRDQQAQDRKWASITVAALLFLLMALCAVGGAIWEIWRG
jgi:hypothetical protein